MYSIHTAVESLSKALPWALSSKLFTLVWGFLNSSYFNKYLKSAGADKDPDTK